MDFLTEFIIVFFENTFLAILAIPLQVFAWFLLGKRNDYASFKEYHSETKKGLGMVGAFLCVVFILLYFTCFN